jgi:lipopolysaccharide transport system permease protein
MEFEIRPASRFRIGLKELWEYRELFFYFTWRDIKVRYRQTYLGALWAVLQPLLLTAVFTLFFARTLGIDSGKLPYHLFAFAGMMTWTFFSTGLTTASNSLVSASNIIRKIYFPRLILPVSAILAALLDFAITFMLLILLVLQDGLSDRIPALLLSLPCTLLLSLISLAGAGLFFSALNVKYRDFRYVIPFALQVLFFLSPVIYPARLLPEGPISRLLALNPVGVAIDITRDALAGNPFDSAAFFGGVVSSVVILTAGVLYFRRTEDYFADLA